MEGFANGSIAFEKSSVIPSEAKKLSQLLDVLRRAPINDFRDFRGVSSYPCPVMTCPK
jgi:hypothetical protein